jgi:hypothetical protein
MGTGMAQLRGVAEAQTALEMIGAPAKAALRGVGEATTATPSYPNEPVGATSTRGTSKGWPCDWSNVVAKNPPETDAHPWEGIYWQSGEPCGAPDYCEYVLPSKGDTVTNQNGPVNGVVVGRCIYNSSNAPSPFGDSIYKASSYDKFVVPSNVKKQYVSQWVKFSSNWFFPAGGIKLFNIWTDAVNRAIILEVAASGAARAGYEGVSYTEPPYYMGVRIAYDGADGKIMQSDLLGRYDTDYYDNNPRIYNDTWYQLEYIVDWQTWFVELFLNADLVANGTSSQSMSAANSEFSFTGTLGGQCTGCPELPAAMYLYLDDMYMSYTTT